MSNQRLLAIIPARGGSKGLPRKNIRPLLGRPLIEYSVAFAKACPEIDRCIVSTDDEEIASVARNCGGDVPFLRPAELAKDTTPILPVLQHGLREIERLEGRSYDLVLLLQPTSPVRLPEDLKHGLAILRSDGNASAVVSVSEPTFNPRYVCVEKKDGYLRKLFPTAHQRRQDVPPTFRINGLLYLFRRDYILSTSTLFGDGERYLALEVPEERAADIDTLRDFERTELLLREGWLRLPWLRSKTGTAV